MVGVRLKIVIYVFLALWVTVRATNLGDSPMDSTEINCTGSQIQFKCLNGKCIDMLRKCDGHSDCTDGSDEKFCNPTNCNNNTHYQCQQGGECIDKSMVCDEAVDCHAGEDEKECYFGQACPPERYRCDESRCIPLTWQCDGHMDCSDGNDERNCSSTLNNCGLNQFRCKDFQCIPNEYHCDGTKDCIGGDDEDDCKSATNCRIEEGNFLCRNGRKCLQKDYVCDGSPHCADGSDEGGDCGTRCDPKICQHNCTRTPSGPRCYCKTGFRLSTDNKTCEDINECEGDTLYCDHICQNEVGTATCSCAKGYYLLSDKVSCRTGDPALLIFTVGLKVLAKLLDKSQSWIIWTGELEPTGVAYDPKDEKVYWIAGTKVYSKKLYGNSEPEVFINQGLLRPENLAVDWYGRNVYVTDYESSQIVVCSIREVHCSPLLKNLQHPRAIQLDLTQRYIYWTDVASHKIERAGLDGSKREVIVDDNVANVVWPNGLALDYPASRIYWADARLYHIQSSTLSGMSRKTLPPAEIGHVFSLAVWQDRLYWTDWNQGHHKEIHSCRKRDGKDRRTEFRDESHKISNLVIYHSSMVSDAKNPCQQTYGNGCSHICYLSPAANDGFVCGCPEEMFLASNGFTCQEKDKSQTMIAAESNLYFVELWKIGRPEILHLNYKGLDLGTVSHMDYDPLKKVVFIADSQKGTIFTLNLSSGFTSTVITDINEPIGIAVDWLRSNIYWINGYHKTVEVARMTGHYRNTIIKNLKNPTSIALDVNAGYIFVSEASIFPTIERCELDGSQCKKLVEAHLSIPRAIYLDITETQRRLYWTDSELGKIESIETDGKNRRTELPQVYEPMKIIVTSDAIMWTELKHPFVSSASKTNTSNKREVHLGIDATFRGGNDFSGEWLINIIMVGGQIDLPENPCVNNGKCHHFCFSKSSRVQVCGCAQGLLLEEDNATCVVSECLPSQKKCNNGECILKQFWCDNSVDCDDGSDEKDCSHVKNCTENEFRCSSGQCIDEIHTCDKFFDCSDHSDEDPTKCQKHMYNCTLENEWKCTSGECIPREWRCNGAEQCSDLSDEKGCDSVTCSSSHRRCDDGFCISLRWWCDGDADCKSGEDETDCPCKLGEYKCANGTCLDEKKLCRGEIKCNNETLNLNCSLHEIPIGFQLPLGDIIETHAKDCPTNWRPCSETKLTGDHCVPYQAWCNGTRECLRGEDEDHCRKNCEDGYVKCRVEDTCIPANWRCDGHSDCQYGADEEGCQPMDVISTTVKPSCGFGEYECAPGICIPAKKVCDGHKDCLYGVDESDNCNKCLVNNGGCDQICINNPHRTSCSCREGFRLQEDGISCLDINECEERDICHHNCVNKKGGFLCTCDEGYTLKDDRVTCKSIHAQPWSIATVSSYAVTYMDENLREYQKSIVRKSIDTKGAAYIYNPLNNSLLAIDGINGKIYSVTGDIWEQEFSNFSQITAASLDYVNNNIYLSVTKISSSDKRSTLKRVISTVKVCSFGNKMCGDLFTLPNINIPAMKVSPTLRAMYMCENDGNKNGRIMSRRLDGSGEDTLADTKILRCTSVAVDEVKKRVYWIDGILNRIESIDIIGHDRLTFDTNEIHGANGLIVIDHSLLWFNTETRMMIKCSIQNPKNCIESYHSSEISIVDLKQKYSQSVPTPCPSKDCPQICVPQTSDVPHCMCAVGYVYKNRSCHILNGATFSNEGMHGSCQNNPCLVGTCESKALGFIICRCPPGYFGKYCEVVVKEQPSDGTGGIIAVIVIFLIAILGLIAYVCISKNKPFKFLRDSPYARFRFINNSFGRMKEETSSQPPTPPIARFGRQNPVQVESINAMLAQESPASNTNTIPLTSPPQYVNSQQLPTSGFPFDIDQFRR